ncbi:ABC transporter ATP-binding protein [Bacillus sp. CECT 9360]|uniref:ABC transporter ATP-binding protein n=1 Tax=Bacillus sp. CECT 9360 TaxID=2845821 RepID=UPI001E52CBB0|nr:ABC transporter ATP-binding protein [Bacillus sp. CECT 9360]CAH0345474.1 Sulfate/thiosulfate import ATP-binding protein CysA [Bacillus sp. CECT 9360]
MFVHVNNLQFQYKNATEQTIHDFSLAIEEGEIVSILGNSGSGKSTILRLIAGLEVPKSGSIIINDHIMSDGIHFVHPEKRGVGMVFQDYALFPHMTVADNIKFGLKRINKKQKKERLDEVLNLVGLTNFSKRYPYELSGGQQQRVALARALAPNPSLLMFDEPFSNLDAELQLKIRDELRTIIKKTGITSIFVTHDREDARSLADRIVIMQEGTVAQEGKPCDLLVEDMKQSPVFR